MPKKEEQIFVGIDNEIVELTGKEKETFIKERNKDVEELNILKEKDKLQKELKVSIYKKLGLTDDEIAAIL